MENNTTVPCVTKYSHHDRVELCTSRPPYRQGKKLTAVKVYTVNEESQHLLIRGVPALNLQKELKHLCLRYGDVKFVNLVPKYAEDEESFTEVYHVLYAKIQSARFSKHMLDDRSFYGGVLHVCYAPELESLTETKQKLLQRKRDVLKRINQSKPNQMVSTSEDNEDSISGPSTVHPGAQNINRDAYGQFINGAGVIGQQFIPYRTGYAPMCDALHSRDLTNAAPRIGPQPKKSEHPTTSVASAWRSTQDSVAACSSSVVTKSIPSQPTITRRKPAPDKFLPSSVKRIRFNKVP